MTETEKFQIERRNKNNAVKSQQKTNETRMQLKNKIG